MRAVVTGAAGFIGSHLVERLVATGHRVVGIDAFTDAYDPALKWRNLESVRGHPHFQLVAGDLLDLDLGPLLDGADVVFHLAAQAGVRGGWGADFPRYLERNLTATHRLLGACCPARIGKLVFASSSSVYGEAARLPAAEEDPCRPLSPYAITKLAAELLVAAYGARSSLPCLALRLFAVYGPRQRPDMAFSRFIAAIYAGRPVPIFGDGRQTRDFTHVMDVVDALERAWRCPATGGVLNVGSGRSTAILEVIEVLERITGRAAILHYLPPAPGEPAHTLANIAKARAALGYAPRVSLEAGLRSQVDWTLTPRSATQAV